MHRQRRITVEGEELASVRERCTGIEQTFDNLQVFLEAGNTHRGTVICQATLGVFVSGPAGADAELEPSVGEKGHGRGLGGEHQRVAEVVGEHERAHAQRGRGVGRGDHGGHRRELVAEMVGEEQRRIPEVGGLPSLVGPRPPALGHPRLHAEAERLHRVRTRRSTTSRSLINIG